jgi:hypothetical protein
MAGSAASSARVTAARTRSASSGVAGGDGREAVLGAAAPGFGTAVALSVGSTAAPGVVTAAALGVGSTATLGVGTAALGDKTAALGVAIAAALGVAAVAALGVATAIAGDSSIFGGAAISDRSSDSLGVPVSAAFGGSASRGAMAGFGAGSGAIGIGSPILSSVKLPDLAGAAAALGGCITT